MTIVNYVYYVYYVYYVHYSCTNTNRKSLARGNSSFGLEKQILTTYDA